MAHPLGIRALFSDRHFIGLKVEIPHNVPQKQQAQRFTQAHHRLPSPPRNVLPLQRQHALDLPSPHPTAYRATAWCGQRTFPSYMTIPTIATAVQPSLPNSASQHPPDKEAPPSSCEESRAHLFAREQPAALPTPPALLCFQGRPLGPPAERATPHGARVQLGVPSLQMPAARDS